MAQPTISETFVTKFERDTHLTYRQMGSKFRGLVRTDGSVNAESCRFYVLGSVTVGDKTRNGDIPVQNPAHSYKTATMADSYTALLLDELDLTKLTSDVRSSYVKATAAAFGDKTDDTVIDAMESGATLTEGTHAGGLTRNFVLLVEQQLNDNNVPRDGRRFFAVTPAQWSFLMTIDEFIRADYIGPSDLPFLNTGEHMRSWNGFNWFCSTRLPGSGTASSKCYAWHMDAIGHGINSEVNTSWAWENLKRAWSMSGSMSMGAVVIDATGLIEVRTKDDATLPT